MQLSQEQLNKVQSMGVKVRAILRRMAVLFFLSLSAHLTQSYYRLLITFTQVVSYRAGNDFVMATERFLFNYTRPVTTFDTLVRSSSS